MILWKDGKVGSEFSLLFFQKRPCLSLSCHSTEKPQIRMGARCFLMGRFRTVLWLRLRLAAAEAKALRCAAKFVEGNNLLLVIFWPPCNLFTLFVVLETKKDHFLDPFLMLRSLTQVLWRAVGISASPVTWGWQRCSLISTNSKTSGVWGSRAPGARDTEAGQRSSVTTAFYVSHPQRGRAVSLLPYYEIAFPYAK